MSQALPGREGKPLKAGNQVASDREARCLMYDSPRRLVCPLIHTTRTNDKR